MRNMENPGPNKSPEKKSSYPLSFKLKKLFLTAVLGLGFLTSGCGVVENRAKANIEAAGISPIVANDPDLIWQAMNGAGPDELRDYANGLLMQYQRESSEARETQMAFDEANQKQDTPEPQQEEVVEQPVSLEQAGEGVYSFATSDKIEITDKDFIRKMRISLGQKINSEINRVFVAVPDDDFGVTRIFMDSTVESYKDANGVFYAYPGDVVYVSTDINALTNFLNAQGILHETFGLP